MNDRARYMMEVKAGLSSPFGRWLMDFLKTRSAIARDNGVQLVPETPGQAIEREQIFGEAKALNELVDQIPNTINGEIEKLEQEEKS